MGNSFLWASMAKISSGSSTHLPFPSLPCWVLSHQITTLPPTVAGSQGSHVGYEQRREAISRTYQSTQRLGLLT